MKFRIHHPKQSEREIALRDIIREAMSALPDHPHPDLVIGALAHMVWMARTDLVDLKRRLKSEDS